MVYGNILHSISIVCDNKPLEPEVTITSSIPPISFGNVSLLKIDFRLNLSWLSESLPKQRQMNKRNSDH